MYIRLSDSKDTPTEFVHKQGQKILCPKCQSELIRNRKDKELIYFRCDKCKGKFKAKYYLIQRTPLCRLSPYLDEPKWMDAALKQAINAIRDDLKDNEDVGLSIDKEKLNDDEKLIWELLHKDSTIYDGFDMPSQNMLWEAVDKCIQDSLNQSQIKKILRFVLYANILKHNTHYNNILDAVSESYESVSTNILPTRSMAHKRNKKRLVSPKS